MSGMRFLPVLLLVACSACSWPTVGCEYRGPEPAADEYEAVERRLGLRPGYIREECGPVYLHELTPEEADYNFIPMAGTEVCGDHAYTQWVPERDHDGLTVTHEVMHWALECVFGDSDGAHRRAEWEGLR